MSNEYDTHIIDRKTYVYFFLISFKYNNDPMTRRQGLQNQHNLSIKQLQKLIKINKIKG